MGIKEVNRETNGSIRRELANLRRLAISAGEGMLDDRMKAFKVVASGGAWV
jgi:hypothetical protein